MTVKINNGIIQKNYKCIFDNLLAYIRSTRVPTLPLKDEAIVYKLEDDGSKITKIIKKKLRINKATEMYLGYKYVYLTYNIIYNNERILITSRNPIETNNKFQFEEILKVEKISEDEITVTRDYTTYNYCNNNLIKTFLLGSSVEENYHLQIMEYWDAIVSEC